MLNKIILQGRLTKNPEIRKTQTGKTVASISIANNTNRKDKDGNYITYFFNAIAWNHNAEFLERYFKKGDPILIEGMLTNRAYEQEDATRRTIAEILINEINFCGSNVSNTSNQAPTQSDDYANSLGITADDLPF